MELKDYLQIIKKHRNLFIFTILIIILASFAYFYLRPISYNTSITLNITRIGVQTTSEYKYDDFYRIQADDKFAETIVEWLQSPRVISDIYKEAGIDSKNLSFSQLMKVIKPKKLSSQVISVNYSTPDQKTGENLARAISSVITQDTQSLNKDQQEETWFEVIAQEPVIKQNTVNPIILLVISLLVGMFVAFWAVMLKYYLE